MAKRRSGNRMVLLGLFCWGTIPLVIAIMSWKLGALWRGPGGMEPKIFLRDSPGRYYLALGFCLFLSALGYGAIVWLLKQSQKEKRPEID